MSVVCVGVGEYAGVRVGLLCTFARMTPHPPVASKQDLALRRSLLLNMLDSNLDFKDGRGGLHNGPFVVSMAAQRDSLP